MMQNNIIMFYCDLVLYRDKLGSDQSWKKYFKRKSYQLHGYVDLLKWRICYVLKCQIRLFNSHRTIRQTEAHVLNMAKVKRDIDQQDLKIVNLHFVKSG